MLPAPPPPETSPARSVPAPGSRGCAPKARCRSRAKSSFAPGLAALLHRDGLKSPPPLAVHRSTAPPKSPCAAQISLRSRSSSVSQTLRAQIDLLRRPNSLPLHPAPPQPQIPLRRTSARQGRAPAMPFPLSLFAIYGAEAFLSPCEFCYSLHI